MQYLFNKLLIILLFTSTFLSCDKEPEGPSTGFMQLTSAKVGVVSILGDMPIVPGKDEIVLTFSVPIDPATNNEVQLIDKETNEEVILEYQNLDMNKILTLRLNDSLSEAGVYQLNITDQLKGANNESFPGLVIEFEVENKPLELIEVRSESRVLSSSRRNIDIPLNIDFALQFSHEVPTEILREEIVLVGDKNYDFNVSETGDKTFRLTTEEPVTDFIKLNLLVPSSIGTMISRPFESVSFELYTRIDTTPKLPIVSDEELLTLVQSQTFKYFWDFGHPVCGLARERNTSGDIVTSGGSGFGLMAIIVAVERGFITRSQAIQRWTKVFNFLKDADRFHGAWSHWLYGDSGEVRPFSANDDGGDLVETAFLVQGMLTVRQYLDESVPEEKELIDLINELWESVEWDWYTQGGENVLYWHWSPNFGWEKDHEIRGHNETQIVYILAAASPTHNIEPEVYHEGYARSGGMVNGNNYYDIALPIGFNLGGPLFFTHYSYLGLDPRNLEDDYANYWEQNRNHSLINQAYCIANPDNYVGYDEKCWGLTASDGNQGYSAHSPTNDRGVITPTAAISSIPYTPEESMDAIRHFYYALGDRLWGEYGFYDAFNPTAGWYASSYLAIDQGPIICMIENYRTGLLWDLFMSAPEVTAGLNKLGFNY